MGMQGLALRVCCMLLQRPGWCCCSCLVVPGLVWSAVTLQNTPGVAAWVQSSSADALILCPLAFTTVEDIRGVPQTTAAHSKALSTRTTMAVLRVPLCSLWPGRSLQSFLRWAVCVGVRACTSCRLDCVPPAGGSVCAVRCVHGPAWLDTAGCGLTLTYCRGLVATNPVTSRIGRYPVMFCDTKGRHGK